MEIPAKIVFFSDGHHELYVEMKKGTDTWIEVSEAELKAMGERKKAKKRAIKISDEPEVDLTKEYEEGAKQKIKAFLKKKLSERKAKKAKKPKKVKAEVIPHKPGVPPDGLREEDIVDEESMKTYGFVKTDKGYGSLPMFRYYHHQKLPDVYLRDNDDSAVGYLGTEKELDDFLKELSSKNSKLPQDKRMLSTQLYKILEVRVEDLKKKSLTDKKKKDDKVSSAEKVFDNPDLRNLLLGKRKDMMMYDVMIKILKERVEVYRDDHADDMNPHPQDFDSLMLKGNETKSKALFPYYYFYGGNGSGRYEEASAFVKAYQTIKPSFQLKTKDKLVPDVRTFLDSFENRIEDEEEFEDYVEEFNPMKSGILVLIIKVKDAKQRKEANQFVKTWQEAMEKIIF